MEPEHDPDDSEPLRLPAARSTWTSGGERFYVELVNASLPYGPSVTWGRDDNDAPEELMLDEMAWEILRLRQEVDDDNREERARIRRELLAELSRLDAENHSRDNSTPDFLALYSRKEIKAALDRIVPAPQLDGGEGMR